MMSHVQTSSFEKSSHCYWMLPSITILLGGNYLTVDMSKSYTWSGVEDIVEDQTCPVLV